ncbi:unnamed protein product, partial [Amoebophrya sp. A25]
GLSDLCRQGRHEPPSMATPENPEMDAHETEKEMVMTSRSTNETDADLEAKIPSEKELPENRASRSFGRTFFVCTASTRDGEEKQDHRRIGGGASRKYFSIA